MEQIESRQIDIYDDFIEIEYSSKILRKNQTDEHTKNLKQFLEPWVSSHHSGGIRAIILRFFPKDGFFKLKKPEEPEIQLIDEVSLTISLVNLPLNARLLIICFYYV